MFAEFHFSHSSPPMKMKYYENVGLLHVISDLVHCTHEKSKFEATCMEDGCGRDLCICGYHIDKEIWWAAVTVRLRNFFVI